MAERLLTAEEARDQLAEHGIDVGIRTVRRWIKARHLRSVMLPTGRYFVPADALDEFLVESKAAGASRAGP